MDKCLNKLRQDGIAYAPWFMSFNQLFELNSYLNNCNVCNTHVWAKADKHAHISEVRNRAWVDGHRWPVFSCHMDNIVLAPHFFEYAIKGFDLAKEYFGEQPRLYSMNCFWTQPGTYKYKDTHWWHRDGDDRKQLVMFMFGTTVADRNDGVHLYQKGSHLKNDSQLGYPFEKPPEDIIEEIQGKAGTIFFTDTCGLHMGIRPNKLRMLCWARWGVSPKPASYIWDKLQYVPKELLAERYPSNPELQKAIELIVS